jgi:hypothetical protein
MIIFIFILLGLILLVQFKLVRILIGLFILLMWLNWPAHSQQLEAFPSDATECVCVQNSCNNACIRKPDPEVVAALRKRFRDLQEDDLMVLYDGQGGFDVAFWTTDAHRACHLTLKPVKLTNCRQVHG